LGASKTTKKNQMTNKLPHDHDYPVSAGVGLTANQTGIVNPSDEITIAEWEAMTKNLGTSPVLLGRLCILEFTDRFSQHI
jgi:hypothetical protein